MLAQLILASDDSEQYVKVWEHYAGPRLAYDQLIEIAGSLIRDLLGRFGSDASMGHPAMVAVWRLARRHVQRDTQTSWLIEQIQSVLPTSLGLATDLFQYWASSTHGIVSRDHRAQVRSALADVARTTFTTVDALISSLGPKHDYPLTRLVYPPPSDEPPDTQPLNGWGWLVDLIVAAAPSSDRIIPDVAIMVGDTSAGFRSGRFDERYKLKRDWLAEIFGVRTDDMLRIFAEYEGKNEYALGAKAEAKKWLAERADPAAPA